jgi:predicted nucleic acid-binding Zn ribbon protein
MLWQEVERVCPNCGNTLRPAARFCDLCGEECVKVRHVRRRRKRKKGCFLIFAAILLWLVAGVSAVAIYEASRDMSFKRILTSVRDNFPASAPTPVPESEQAEEEPDGVNGAAISEDSRETEVSYDSPPLVMPLTEDEPDMSALDLRYNGPGDENAAAANPAENAGGGEPISGEEGEGRAPDTAENTPPDSESGALVPVSPLSASSESEDAAASASDDRQGADAWTEQDPEGYSTVSASDRFFTSAQTPSLRGIVTANHVRVRSAPNTGSMIKRQLDSGAEVELVRRFSSGKEGHYWFETRDSAGSGWIYGEFVKPEAGASEIPSALSADTAVINTSSPQ